MPNIQFGMSNRPLVPATSRHRVEDVIKRSRFITTMGRVQAPEEAKAFMASVRAEFADATHNCWAYVAGPAGETAHVGMSDGGEPHGTAGKPMLNVLLHSGVGEIAAVVTRYYGGTKLGTGGLVRAYSGMVTLGLESLPLKENVETLQARVFIPYSFVAVFKNVLPEFEVEVLEERFEAEASFFVQFPKEHMIAFEACLADMTSGKALFSHLKKSP